MAELDWFTIQRDQVVDPHAKIHLTPPQCINCKRFLRASRNSYGHIIRNEDGSIKYWVHTCDCFL